MIIGIQNEKDQVLLLLISYIIMRVCTIEDNTLCHYCFVLSIHNVWIVNVNCLFMKCKALFSAKRTIFFKFPHL